MRAHCSVAGCTRPLEARGCCTKHYQRLRATGSPTGLKINRRSTLKEAFDNGYAVAGSGCWLWCASVNPTGYGVLTYRRKRYLAHRVSHMLSHGPIRRGMQVNHKCDVPRCVNPAHLYLGTQKQNIADMLKRGRTYRKGESAHGIRKLSTKDVLAIRSRKEKPHVVASIYGVSYQTINDVRSGRSWSHV